MPNSSGSFSNDSDMRWWFPVWVHGWEVSKPVFPWSPDLLMLGGYDNPGRKWLGLCPLRDIRDKMWTLQGASWASPPPPPWWVLALQTPEGPSFSVWRSSPPIRSPEAVGVTRIAFLEFMADTCSQEGYNSPSTEIEFSTALGNDDLQIW